MTARASAFLLVAVCCDTVRPVVFFPVLCQRVVKQPKPRCSCCCQRVVTQPKPRCSCCCQRVVTQPEPWCSRWCQCVVTQPKPWCSCCCQRIVTRHSPSQSQGNKNDTVFFFFSCNCTLLPNSVGLLRPSILQHCIPALSLYCLLFFVAMCGYTLFLWP